MPLIVDAVNIPVLTASGIVDNRGVKASLALELNDLFKNIVLPAQNYNQS